VVADLGVGACVMGLFLQGKHFIANTAGKR